MTRPRSTYRIATVIALLGVLIAVLPITMISGVRSAASVFENLEHVVVLVRQAETSPWFDDVSPESEDRTAQLISFPHISGKKLLIEFPRTMSIDNITAVMRSGAREGGALQKNPLKAERLRFREWVTERQAATVPYRYFLLCGLLLAFVAAFVVLLGHRHGS